MRNPDLFFRVATWPMKPFVERVHADLNAFAGVGWFWPALLFGASASAVDFVTRSVAFFTFNLLIRAFVLFVFQMTKGAGPALVQGPKGESHPVQWVISGLMFWVSFVELATSGGDPLVFVGGLSLAMFWGFLAVEDDEDYGEPFLVRMWNTISHLSYQPSLAGAGR